MGFINLGSIGKAFTGIIKTAIPVATKLLLGPVGSAALDIFKQVGGGLLNKTGSGGLFSDKIPISLPNPLSRLNGLLGNIGQKFNGVGDFLSKIGDFLSGKRHVGGQDVTVPKLGDRAAAVASRSSAVAAEVAGGRYDSALNQTLADAGKKGGMYDASLTGDQQKMLAGLEEPQKSRMALQMKMQNQAELNQFISNIAKLMHDMSMGIIRNIQA